MKKKYDYLIVGAGLFGSVFAHKMKQQGKSCLVIDKRNHIGGNIYTNRVEGIDVHQYGAHIFHTNDDAVWAFVNQFASFNNFVNSPVANYKGKLYNLPFNMNTFYAMWGVTTPEEAQAKIKEQQGEFAEGEPQNLEEQALKLVGRDIYETLIKEYTEKQWGRPCTELPAFIIRRLPVRFTFDNNYFNAKYQGIPVEGYAKLIENMLEGIEVRLNTNFLANRQELSQLADKILYTGPIDEYFDYQCGALQYRRVHFDTQVLNQQNHQGTAVVNYTSKNEDYTRIIEHKHFTFGTQPKTVISKEYSVEWNRGDEPYYPVNNQENDGLYNQYSALAATQPNVIFGGRLGQFKYMDMDVTIAQCLELVHKKLEQG